MSLFVFFSENSQRQTAVGLDKGYVSSEPGIFKNSAQTPDKTLINYMSLRLYPIPSNTATSMQSLNVDVPIDAMIRFSDTVMSRGRQLKALDLTKAGQTRFKDAYESGNNAFSAFLQEHVPTEP